MKSAEEAAPSKDSRMAALRPGVVLPTEMKVDHWRWTAVCRWGLDQAAELLIAKVHPGHAEVAVQCCKRIQSGKVLRMASTRADKTYRKVLATVQVAELAEDYDE
jgi:hypothetical protein